MAAYTMNDFLLVTCLPFVITILLGCEGVTSTPSASPAEEQPEAAPELTEPRPVYTSAICCVIGRTCTLDDGARPLGTTCECRNPEGDALQGHVC